MPSPGDLPDPEIEPEFLMSSALAGGFFTTSTTWETPVYTHTHTHTHTHITKMFHKPVLTGFLNPYLFCVMYSGI